MNIRSCPIYRAIKCLCPINWATTIILILCICLPAHAKQDEKKPKVLRIQSGTSVPSLGLVMDASYDPSTDNIVPGYKILTVAITNNSINILQLSAESDEWVVVDIKRRKHNAVVSLKNKDPDAYLKLPQKLRKLIDYPSMVQVGETRMLDLLFKDNVNLDAFRMVKYTNGSSKQSIEIIAQED